MPKVSTREFKKMEAAQVAMKGLKKKGYRLAYIVRETRYILRYHK